MQEQSGANQEKSWTTGDIDAGPAILDTSHNQAFIVKRRRLIKPRINRAKALGTETYSCVSSYSQGYSYKKYDLHSNAIDSHRKLLVTLFGSITGSI